MPFSLATIRHNGQPTAVIEIDNHYWDLCRVAPSLLSSPESGLLDVFRNWELNEPLLLALADELAADKSTIPPLQLSLQDDDVLTPLQYPSKVILTGANYWDHVLIDMKMTDYKKEDYDPLFFCKAQNSLVGAGKSVRYPAQSTQLDWEVELAVIFGKKGKRISSEDALSYVAGYSIGLDLSARDWQLSERHPKCFDLFTGKMFDDSNPIGPSIVPACFIDPSALDLKLWVNDELKQDSNTREMIWSISEQIVAISKHVTIEPGDILLTGSPSGIGLVNGEFLGIGDKIRAEIPGLGQLNVEIIKE